MKTLQDLLDDLNGMADVVDGSDGQQLPNTAMALLGEYGETIADAIATRVELVNALRRAVIALAFAAETSPAILDEYKAVSDAIARAARKQ